MRPPGFDSRRPLSERLTSAGNCVLLRPRVLTWGRFVGRRLVSLAVVVIALSAAAVARADTFIVNDPSDSVETAPGCMTLRQAIAAANTGPARPDVIDFGLASGQCSVASGPWLITLT